MKSTPASYFETLGAELGRGWNRFWFAPSDPIALGVLRIAVGLMALYLVALYTPDLERFFGRNGLVPVHVLNDMAQQMGGDIQSAPGQVREAIPREFRFSYLDRVPSGASLKLVHVLGLVVLLLFTLGLFTRITSVASLVVFLSYLHRGPMLTSGAEAMVAMLLFYLCIGPAGSLCSLDARIAAKRRTEFAPVDRDSEAVWSPWATVAVRLIQVHLTLVYAMMAVSKLGNDAWWSGLGIWWLITRAESRMIDLTGLHKLPLLVNAWTYAILLWQSFMPIFIWNRLARPLMLGLNAVMWLLLAPIIGNIPLAVVMIVASMAFVSPEFLRKFVPTRTAEPSAVAAHAAA